VLSYPKNPQGRSVLHDRKTSLSYEALPSLAQVGLKHFAGADTSLPGHASTGLQSPPASGGLRHEPPQPAILSRSSQLLRASPPGWIAITCLVMGTVALALGLQYRYESRRELRRRLQHSWRVDGESHGLRATA
jgi:hypothetical protein